MNEAENRAKHYGQAGRNWTAVCKVSEVPVSVADAVTSSICAIIHGNTILFEWKKISAKASLPFEARTGLQLRGYFYGLHQNAAQIHCRSLSD